MNVIGRLKPGVSIAQASAELSAIAARMNEAYPDDRASTTQAKVMGEVEGRFEDMGGVFKTAGAMAMAIVGLILLIACANVANLMLAKSRRASQGDRNSSGPRRKSRPPDPATADRESFAFPRRRRSGFVARVLGHDLMEGFVPILEYNIVNDFFALDSRALIFTLVISLGTGLVFGLAPAWQSSNPDVVPVLKGDPEAALRGKRKAFGCGTCLVVAQVRCRSWCWFAVVSLSRVFARHRRWILVSIIQTV